MPKRKVKRKVKRTKVKAKVVPKSQGLNKTTKRLKKGYRYNKRGQVVKVA